MADLSDTKIVLEIKPTHYHVTVVSSRFSIEPFVTSDIIEAEIQYGKTIRVLEDQTGLPPIISKTEWPECQCMFLDGSYVRIRLCEGDCLNS